ncbi:MAG TPA: amino acid adenylation domain-containing protein, partial [Thermoanaerobaculia bacterium]|nr:amino acid adenylation domain-containing protein [Thermoanaerobaculia bacterium]
MAEGSFSSAELARCLAARLPSYMVPASFVRLASFPVTRNGKVDRAALERLDLPSQEGVERRRERTAPADPVQAMVARIWEEVLGVEAVGPDDSFFALGGHSLLATRAVARLREVFGRELPVSAVFEAPTVAELARRIAEALTGTAPPIGRADRGAPLPLSYAQERLWFLDQLHPGLSQYNMAAAWTLSGRLDVAALERSLRSVVARHESLRTRFPDIAGRPVQEISPAAAAIALPVVDLGGLAAERRPAELRRVLVERAAQPFSLVHGPVMRAGVVQLGAEAAVLAVTFHHIVCDGWSLGIFLRDLAGCYAAEIAGGAGEAHPDLAVQYADFAVWQRQWLRGEVLARLQSYWQSRLAGAPPLALPTDRPRPAAPGFRGAHVRSALDRELVTALTDLSQQRGVTLYMTCLAAFQTLLHRYSGQNEILVGSPIANRHHPGLEDLIGYFANTLVLRGDCAGDPTFAVLLDRIGKVAIEAYAHQDLPFERLVAQLQPERDLSRNPLVQVVLALQNAQPELALAGLAAERQVVDAGVTRFDLELHLKEQGGGLAGVLIYDRDLFDRTTIERLGWHWENLLAAVAGDPRRSLSQLRLLTAAEQQQLVEYRYDGISEQPWPVLTELFAAQAERTPDAIAVESAFRQLTYSELDRRANRLGRFLVHLGIGLESRVGLLLARSVELVVGLLGILKAGGAYVPLDPAQGEERLRFMLEDAAVVTVVTCRELSGSLPASLAAGRSLVLLDDDGTAISRQLPTAPPTVATAESLAYVLYTSGSTGRPKGAEIPHRAVPGFCLNVHYVDYDGGQRFLQYASISWDVLTLELWPSLLHGGRCTLVAERLLSGEDLERSIAAHGVTTLWVTSSQFNAVMDTHPEAFSELAQLMVGGEALSPSHLRRARARFPGLRLVNGYGPSECTVFAVCHPLPPGEEVAVGPIPIGRPIGDRVVHVLDHSLGPVPLGIPGELAIGGASVARGYLGRPDLTAERFVPDAFSPRPGERLYRTGDLVRWRRDGRLDFVARLDDQVKVRGFRVEPGEIEAVLRAHPRVEEAAVLALPDALGEPRLVAYVVPPGPAGLETDLRTYLGGHLPPYMVPAAFVLLSRLPLNASGKLDRAALPPPVEVAQEGRFVAPQSPFEAKLAALWSALLNVERVGIEDDFFALGGHSLLATRLVT